MIEQYDRNTRIGFIGLGTMGAGMARRLVGAGYETALYNRTAARAEPFREMGATIAISPRDVADRSRVLFLSLPETHHVESVLFGEEGVADHLKPGACVIDTSTISAAAVRDFAKRLGDRGVHLLDAPVSGGKKGAEEGTLTCMVGGPEEVFEACRDVCSAIATRYLRMGDHGAGQIAKCCNQVAVVNAMLGVAEALTLAAKHGVEPTIVREALLGGAAKSFSLEIHGRRMIDRNYVPGFTARLMLKDLDLAAKAGHEGGVFLPGTHVVLQLLESMCASGSADLDWSSLGALIERMSGVDHDPIDGRASNAGE